MATDLTQALAALRSQRHGFLNHLQVIAGWLQLGKSERALQYLQRVAARMEAQGQALRSLDDPATELLLLEMELLAEPAGVALVWQIAGPAAPESLAEGRAAIAAAIDRAAGQPDGQRNVQITLDRSVAVHTPSTEGAG